MWKLNIKVIKIGSCTVDPGNTANMPEVMLKRQLGIGGGSTVTLIRENKDVLLIDTGYDYEDDFSESNNARNRQFLAELLRLHGIICDDVTKVFITHLHADHCGGIESFPNAIWLCHQSVLDNYEGHLKERFVGVADGVQIAPNTVVKHTPGHTRGHASVIWTTDSKSLKVAIAGDAILNLAWLKSGHTWQFNSDFFDLETARKSASSLIQDSDIIIPGHGQPFFTRKGMINKKIN
jgi:glyoxylase-like metal-dependent hydrolase (beta-lactamase superfamily II)